VDWLLRPEDLDAPALMHRLRDSEHDFHDSPARRVRERLLPNCPGLGAGDAADADADARRLCDALNGLLQEAEPLYPTHWLQPDSEAFRLGEQGPRRPGPAAGTEADAPADGSGREEHVQLNRLLLEAAFAPQLVARVDNVRLAQLYRHVHALPQKRMLRSALCLSGGGIRSASFALGGIQALAGRSLLERFDYLSTVSGGGYSGSWLSTWVHRHEHHLRGVSEELRAARRRDGGPWAPKTAPEPEPVRFLRRYSHFLNARAGLFTVDTWTWAGLYLRNLALNWLVLIPLLMGLLLLPRLFAALAAWFAQSPHPLPPPLFALASVAAVCTVLCAILNRPSASDPARRTHQPPAVQAAAPRAPDRLLRRLKQPPWIVMLGLVPLLLFATLLALFAWGLPAHKQVLPLDQLLPWLLSVVQTAPLAALPALLPPVLLDHVVVWGEAVIAVAWLVSLPLLRGTPLRLRLLDLLALLAAGLLTWWLVSELVPLFIGWEGSGAPGWADGLQPLHLYTLLGAPAVVLAVLAGMTLFIGLVSKWRWIEDEDREWWARFGAWTLIAALGWIALSAVVVLGPLLLFEWPRLFTALGGFSGLAGVLLGKSALTPSGHKNGNGAASQGKLGALAGPVSTSLLAAVFLAAFLSALSLLGSAGLVALQNLTGDWSANPHCLGPDAVKEAAALFSDARLHTVVLCRASVRDVFGALALLSAFTALAGLCINFNKFSLHAAYRIRIARTFLGASRGTQRKPNPFTGFDPQDNVRMHELQPGLLREIDLASATGLVQQLHQALNPNAPRDGTGPDPRPEVTVVARLVCERHDPEGHLQARLRSWKPGHAVLAALLQDLVTALNRVLETERLEQALGDCLDGLCGGDKAMVLGYVRHGQRIFANRKLLELSFPGVLPCFGFPPPPPHKLMHVLNLTLNLVHGRDLAWQERKAAPFSVSPIHSGSYYLGYRPSRDYGGGISIATAAAVSGAAVSPNMGYSSSPLTALLLTLFNVRLGWWLGNPGIDGAGTWHRSEPKFSLRPVLSEALGMTDDRSPYVYLSDGGHFENLGLFEMVLRRCHFIVVFDAGADPDYVFDDLGNAVRKIRLDLGISIDVEPMPIRKRKDAEDTRGRYCAIGRIGYSAVDGPDAPDGLLLYFKPVLCGGEPRDVQHYGNQNPDFPQESTADQFFGEAQFESYRRLGQWAVEQVLDGNAPAGFGWAASAVRRACRHIEAGCGAGALRQAWLGRWLQRFSPPPAPTGGSTPDNASGSAPDSPQDAADAASTTKSTDPATPPTTAAGQTALPTA
jgi:hypothetical protein